MKSKAEEHHDKGIDKIVERLMNSNEEYVVFTKELYYGLKGNGEIDVLALNDDYLLYFEHKGRNSYIGRKKALKQLAREKAYLSYEFPKRRLFGFYTYQEGNKIIYKWVK